MWANPQETVNFVISAEEILNKKLHFLCSAHWPKALLILVFWCIKTYNCNKYNQKRCAEYSFHCFKVSCICHLLYLEHDGKHVVTTLFNLCKSSACFTHYILKIFKSYSVITLVTLRCSINGGRRVGGVKINGGSEIFVEFNKRGCQNKRGFRDFKIFVNIGNEWKKNMNV